MPIEVKDELLKTIHIPKNLLYLTDRLPRPNYEDKVKLDDEESLPSIRKRHESQSKKLLVNLKKQEYDASKVLGKQYNHG